MQAREIRFISVLSSIARSYLVQSLYRVQIKKLQEHQEVEFRGREQEMGILVHDINNTVQDLMLYCDSILDDFLENDFIEDEPITSDHRSRLQDSIKRIAIMGRSVATIVSDAKRSREIERMSDLAPRELVEVCSVVKEILTFAI